MNRYQLASVVALLLLLTTRGVSQDTGNKEKAGDAVANSTLGGWQSDPTSQLIAAYQRAETLKQQGKLQEAINEYRKVVALSVQVLGPDDVKTAIVETNLGLLYSQTHFFGEAETLFQRALVTFEKRLGKTHPTYATCLWNLARACQVQGEYSRAEPLYRQVVEIRKQAVGESDPSYFESFAELGRLHFLMGNYSEAKAIYEQVVQLGKQFFRKTHAAELAGVVNSLGLVYYYTGDYRKAESHLRRSLDALKEVKGEKSQEYASGLHNMGRLYRAQGDFARAEPFFRQALEIRKQLRGQDRDEYALSISLSELAELYLQNQDYARAEPLFREALEMVRQIKGVKKIIYSPRLNDLARLYHEKGDYPAAEPLYQQALDGFKEAGRETHPLYAEWSNNLARLYQDQGDYIRAEPLFSKVLKIRKQALGEKHPDYAATLENLACLYEATNRSGESWKLATKSMEIRQEMVHSVFSFSSEATMRAHLESIRGTLSVSLSLAQKQQGSSETWTGIGLTWTVRRKGVLLDAVCRFRQYQRELSNKPDLIQKAARWRYLRQQLADLPLKTSLNNDSPAIEKQIQAWQTEADQLEADLHRALSELRGVAADEVDAEKVRQHLPPGGALVEFVRVEIFDFKATGKQSRWKPPHYFAFVLTSAKDTPPRFIDLGPAEPIDQAVRKLRQEIDAAPRNLRLSSEKDVEAEFRAASRTLYQSVFAPLRTALSNNTLVYLAPDDELNRVAFETLVDDQNHYLIENYRFVYLSCGRDLVRPTAKPATGTVVFAGPDFNLNARQRKDQAAALLQNREQVALRGSSAIELRGLRWSPLPGAAAEAADIRKALQDSAYGPVQVYSGAQALEEVFKRMTAPRLLHLATHGFFLEDIPRSPEQVDRTIALGPDARGQERLRIVKNPLLRSGIVLAGANALGEQTTDADVEDGWVTAEEIALLNLQGTDLVVLSACESGLGDIKTGEGVYGLRRAFLYAGSRTLVTSLFKVPDDETRQMMQRFYGSLKAGKGKLEALHDAQLAVIQQRRQEHGAAHPFFWGSFVLVGDPGTLPARTFAPTQESVPSQSPDSHESVSHPASSTNMPWWVGSAAVLLFAGLAGLVWVRARWAARA